MLLLKKRKTDLLWISKIVSKINIPFCVGGGITSVEDVENCINIGAEKSIHKFCSYKKILT